MDRAYVACCSGISLTAPNWNETYQRALELEDDTLPRSMEREERLRLVESAFEAEVKEGAMRIVNADASAPPRVPKELLCYLEKNIFYRVLPDCRTGHSMIAALRGILQSRSVLLTVPLTVAVTYKGTPVLAQALAPLGPHPAKVYGDDVESNVEVAAELEIVADASNIPLPDRILCEVYEGLDGRFYVTNTNITTIALDDAVLISPPLKRPEMLALCPCVRATCEDTLRVLRNPVVTEALRRIVDTPSVDQQGRLLCETLHFYGVNLCLLKGVFDAFCERFSAEATVVAAFTDIVATEMLARTIKREFYMEAQARRLGSGDASALDRCYAFHLHAGLEREQEARFLTLVLRTYGVSDGDSEADRLIDALRQVRHRCRSAIVERASWLVGAHSNILADTCVDQRSVGWSCLVAGWVTPHLSAASVMSSLELLYRTPRTCEAHRLACCNPLQIKVAVWRNRLSDALEVALATADATAARYGETSLRAMQARRTLMRLLFRAGTLDEVRAACLLATPLLQGYADGAGPITRVKCHVELGCCLLGASAVMDAVEEAARHFEAAALLLPASLRGSHGAWLYLQPYLGLLRCFQKGRARSSVQLTSLVAEATAFSRAVAPADYCTAYLWELGMEVAVEGDFAASTHLLTLAYSMARCTTNSQLDLQRLRDDALRVYSQWDPERYGAYCASLLVKHTRSSSHKGQGGVASDQETCEE